YGAIKVSPLGQAGGKGVGSGTKSGSGASAGTPSTGSTSFSTLGSGTNTNSNLTVGAGSSISPDPSNPGIVNANQLQGTPVTLTPPVAGQVLQYNGTTLAYTSIIAVGPQSALSSVLPLALGEIYVATDTGNLFIGTPGVGAGYIQVNDMSQTNDTLQAMLAELKGIKLAITALDNTLLPQDFEPFGEQIRNNDLET